MQYQLLVLDIDDTLLGDDKIISKGSLEAIQSAQQAGIYVTIATGRGYFGSSRVYQALHICGPVINYGGALIMDTKTDQQLYMGEIDSELVLEALELAHALHLHAQIYQNDTVIFEQGNEFTRRYSSFLSLPYREDPDIRKKQWHSVPKVLIYVDPSKEAQTQAYFAQHFCNRLGVAASKPGFVELNRFGVHKGSAVQWLANRLGIPMERVAAIGDNTLDLEMIRMAGLGACVANGQACIRELADVVVPACDQDGVAWFIEHYLMRQGK